MRHLSRAKSEAAKSLPILGACLALMLFLGITGLGFVDVSATRQIDTLIIPVIFSAMIGGLWAGIPAALMWAWFISGALPTTNTALMNYGAHLLVALGAWHGYQLARKFKPGDPYNVYRGIVAATIIHAIATIFTNTVTPLEALIAGFIPETIITSVIMWAVIDKLRQLHILNGIRKEADQHAIDLS